MRQFPQRGQRHYPCPAEVLKALPRYREERILESEAGWLSPKEDSVRSEWFKRVSYPSLWLQESIWGSYYKTARKWASVLRPSVYDLREFPNYQITSLGEQKFFLVGEATQNPLCKWEKQILYDNRLEMLQQSLTSAPAQRAGTAPILPNREDSQEGERRGERKACADELLHGELIDLVVQGGCHHPSQRQGQLQDDEHLSCGRDRGYQGYCAVPSCSLIAESLGGSPEPPPLPWLPLCSQLVLPGFWPPSIWLFP